MASISCGWVPTCVLYTYIYTHIYIYNIHDCTCMYVSIHTMCIAHTCTQQQPKSPKRHGGRERERYIYIYNIYMIIYIYAHVCNLFLSLSRPKQSRLPVSRLYPGPWWTICRWSTRCKWCCSIPGDRSEVRRPTGRCRWPHVEVMEEVAITIVKPKSSTVNHWLIVVNTG